VFVARTAADLGTESTPGCVTDVTSSAVACLVAPGQLINIYGKSIGPDEPSAGIGIGTSTMPTSLGGVVVSFDGGPAPILYVSAWQLNVQVTFEVQQDATTMEVSLNGSEVASRHLAVVPGNPSLFVSSARVSDHSLREWPE
jgi:uncharacterized protein (TIGR03437 family)